MRSALAGLVLSALAAPASAAQTPEPPPHNAKTWALLIEAAKARGGAETRLDKSTSYVFSQENGDYLTLTEWRSKPPKRFICTIAKDQKATVCVRWETGQTTLGERADDASPWKTWTVDPLEDTPAPSAAGQMLGSVLSFIARYSGSTESEYIVIKRH